MAWSCFSPPLVNSLEGPQGSLSTADFSLTPQRQDWLARLDEDDRPLRHYMQKQCHSRRLGLVFESLWHFFLLSDPATELLGHNIAVRSQGKTLGEFDVIYHCTESGHNIHLELAVKFFLGLSKNHQTPSLKDWFGPNRADRLDRKLARLSQHQLPLAHTEAGRQTLKELGIEIFNQKIQISGILFHQQQHAATAGQLNPGHQRGHWQNLSQFCADENLIRQWRHIEKPQWLESRYEYAQVINHAQLSNIAHRPVMLINAQQQRCFIVPDHWDE